MGWRVVSVRPHCEGCGAVTHGGGAVLLCGCGGRLYRDRGFDPVVDALAVVIVALGSARSHTTGDVRVLEAVALAAWGW